MVNATEIAVDITGPSRAEIIIDALPPSSEETGFSIEYRVTSPGDYLITINDKGKAIPGSPFKTVIHDGDAKKNVGDHTRVSQVGEVCHKHVTELHAVSNTDSSFLVFR